MLAPGDRELLLECLRPPSDYKFDRAIGTTFSLDLITLLTAPLAFTFFDWEDKDGRPCADSLALLEAVRRHADRIHLFCQAGQIKVPKPEQRLVQYLEASVIEARAHHSEGAFHPKVWLVRYVGDGAPRYRFLCLSRNLTFDRSWDTVLALDGVLAIDRQRGYGRNQPLAEFIAALPELTVRPVSDSIASAVRAVADEVRRVDWELPEGLEDIAFWPLGLSRSQELPFRSYGRPLLVLSPFLSPRLLDELTESHGQCTLVSRADALADCPAGTLAKFEAVHVFSSEGEPSEDDDDEGSGDTQGALHGLHAKLYVEDDGWDARVYTGSANATWAAFSRNIEFLTELRGKKSRWGIQQLLGEGDQKGRSLRDLLTQWSPPTDTEPRNPIQVELEARLDELQRALAAAQLHLVAEVAADGELYCLGLHGRLPPAALVDGVEVWAWPIARRWEASQPLSPNADPVAVFESLPAESLSGFLAFEIRARLQGEEQRRRFALNLPLQGAPEDRRERLLRSLLADSDQVLRLLWLLLAAEEMTADDIEAIATRDPGKYADFATLGGFPILEAMLRVLATSPDRLDDIERLLNDLSRTDQGRALLPPGLLEIWEPIRQARALLGTR